MYASQGASTQHAVLAEMPLTMHPLQWVESIIHVHMCNCYHEFTGQLKTEHGSHHPISLLFMSLVKVTIRVYMFTSIHVHVHIHVHMCKCACICDHVRGNQAFVIENQLGDTVNSGA